MKMVSINKAQFADINDKRFYFLVSFSYGHPLLLNLRQEKKNIREKIHKIC